MRGRFDVWAPLPRRVRLSVADEIVEMTRGEDEWWTPVGPVPGTSRGAGSRRGHRDRRPAT